MTAQTPTTGSDCKPKKRNAGEAKLGERAAAWFECEGWRCYHEVSAHCGRADLVLTMGPLRVVVELKEGPSLQLLGQLVRWRPVAHAVVGVCWASRASHAGPMREICAALGIGYGVIDDGTYGERGRLRWLAKPSFTQERPAHPILGQLPLIDSYLNEAQLSKFARAGTNGGYWAPWRDTASNIAEYVKAHGGEARLSVATREVRHHYRTSAASRAGFHFLLSKGLVSGLSIERRGREVWIVAQKRGGHA